MKNTFTNFRSPALIGFLLALPFLMILSLPLLHIEPPFAYLLNSPNPDQPNLTGALIIPMGVFLLAIAVGMSCPCANCANTAGWGKLVCRPCKPDSHYRDFVLSCDTGGRPHRRSISLWDRRSQLRLTVFECTNNSARNL
jgi:hypothetical protein